MCAYATFVRFKVSVGLLRFDFKASKGASLELCVSPVLSLRDSAFVST